jgi:hypothetical protein
MLFGWWWFLWALFLVVMAWAFFGRWGDYRAGRSYYYDEPWRYGAGPGRSYRGYWPLQKRPQSHRGKGPAGYQRSDARIAEDVNDALMVNDDVDAGGVAVSVNDGLVTLSGYVATRAEKRQAEDMADAVPGVKDVKNELQIGPPQADARRLEQVTQP